MDDILTLLNTENIIVIMFVMLFVGTGIFLKREFWPWIKNVIGSALSEYFKFQGRKLNLEEKRLEQNKQMWDENNRLIKETKIDLSDRIDDVDNKLGQMTTTLAVITRSFEAMLNTVMKLASHDEVEQANKVPPD